MNLWVAIGFFCIAAAWFERKDRIRAFCFALIGVGFVVVGWR